MSIDADIDQAVARLSHSGAGPRPIVGAPWLDGVERRLGFSLPPSYRSLVERYAFPVLDVGSAELFANEGDESEYDITVALFRDPHMSPWLAARRLLHIGHPYIGDYDPICLDV